MFARWQWIESDQRQRAAGGVLVSCQTPCRMPVSQPILFCIVTWMEYYRGDHGDRPSGGGSFIDREGYGYEMFNFKPFKRRYYGWVQVPGGIALERLGAENGSESVSNVTVVFVTPLHGKTPYVICGWYRSATVYRFPRDPLAGSERFHGATPIGYNIEAPQNGSELILPVDDRAFEVPRGRGGVGQSRIWYADLPEQRQYVESVRRYIGTRELPKTRRARPHGSGWQKDLGRRQLIEKRAVRAVWNHFEALHYRLKSVERKNLGWDLEASKSTTTLLIEVKGTSGSDVLCEVSPNEYEPLRQKQRDYRLCVVTGALSRLPAVKTFGWSQERGGWYYQDDKLTITELTGARLSI
jgi:hypothetical protein